MCHGMMLWNTASGWESAFLLKLNGNTPVEGIKKTGIVYISLLVFEYYFHFVLGNERGTKI